MSKIRLKQIDEVEISGYIISVTSGDFNSLSGTVSGLTATGDTLSGEYSNLVSLVNILSGQNTGISGRLSTIESEFDAFDTQINNFSGQVYQLSGEIVNLSNDLDLFSGDLVTAETDIATLNTITDTLSGRINTLSGDVLTATGVINTNISTLSGRIDTTSGNLVATNITAAELSGSFNTISGDLNSVSGDLNSVSGELNTFTGRYVNDYVLLLDVSGSGVAGGGFTAGAWRTRNLNTEVSDSGNICSLSGHRITLSGGIYRCDISCPALKVGTHIARLFNVSNSSGVLTGSAEFSSSAAEYSQTRSRIVGQFRVTGSTGQLFEIQHICSVGYGTYGFGAAGSVGVDVSNIYSMAEFTRIST
jgi:outer membrane murein-binding lipoprotein Lpp